MVCPKIRPLKALALSYKNDRVRPGFFAADPEPDPDPDLRLNLDPVPDPDAAKKAGS